MDLTLNFSEIINSTQGYITLVLILLASLIGSLHCAGMCGPLAVCASQKSPVRAILYHFGRLLGYLLVGFLFGLIGKNLLEGNFQYVNLISSIFISVVFFFFAYQLIFKSGLTAKLPEAVSQKLTKALWFTKGRPKLFALSLGILTPLLPCGWFYGFALVAMSTADPLRGALFMTSFWLGTIPALVIVSEATRLGLARLQPKLKAVAGVMFLCLGLFILTNKYKHLSHMGHNMGNHPHEDHNTEKPKPAKHKNHHHH